ncbi:hypothetical protein Dda_4131 [Drechslerella dactyloides]|uniref:Uncharacterized protein n=1 Tax=Drechslerella dactyloides TaxID=74499 RepID=A0AAD6NJ57_DREDA|nr:hypothetical protein Dda_4131 [Drechslerella dactyloides]
MTHGLKETNSSSAGRRIVRLARLNGELQHQFHAMALQPSTQLHVECRVLQCTVSMCEFIFGQFESSLRLIWENTNFEGFEALIITGTLRATLEGQSDSMG